VHLHGVDISPVDQGLVGVGVIGLDAFDQLGLAQIVGALPRLGRQVIGGRDLGFG